MKICVLFYKLFRMCKLWLLKAFSAKKLVLKSKLCDYDIALDTKMSYGGSGKIIMGSISTKSNVHLSAWNGLLQVGSGCRFNRNDIVVAHSRIEIGDKTILGPNVCIFDHDHEFDGNGVIAGKYRSEKVVIGKNVWIGAGTIVLRGTTIGDSCVIGAGCVIKGDIPSRCLVVSENRKLNILPLKEAYPKAIEEKITIYQQE